MRNCFLGLKSGGKEQYFWDPLRAQAVEEELPDKSHSQGGTEPLPEPGGAGGVLSRSKHLSPPTLLPLAFAFH